MPVILNCVRWTSSSPTRPRLRADQGAGRPCILVTLSISIDKSDQSRHVLNVEQTLIDLLKSDPVRWHALSCVEALDIPTACIAAGFVRNFVWDHFHHRTSDCRRSDLDVVWYDPDRLDPKFDSDLEAALRVIDPTFKWSVKNQARMHYRNGDPAYTSVEDAMRYWPETATAIAAQKRTNICSIIAPFGLGDLMDLVLRPASLLPHKRAAFDERAQKKGWLSTWPQLTIAEAH